jgi:NTP pyrophosphatase (non-canonical NTP hydrolase)
MIDITALQSAVAVWLARNFPDRNPLTVIAGTVEEAGELCALVNPKIAKELIKRVARLCRAAVKLDQGIRGTEAEWRAEIAKEVGDVVIKLCDVCDWYDIDLEAAIADRWNTVRNRDWRTDPQGHGRPDDDGA